MPLISPDFPDHWKTRLLAEITGNEAAPLAVVRFWCYCHACKKWEFPTMTADQLRSICRWKIRKISCEAALTQSGFLDKLDPTGYRAHDFQEINGGLCQRWKAGEKGGRPSESEKGNENATSEETGRKPDDNRQLTGKEPINQSNQPTNQFNQSIESNPTNQPPAPAVATSHSEASRSSGGTVIENVFKGRLDGRTDGSDGFASKNRALTFTIPDERTVSQYLNCSFIGAGQYAKPFLKAMRKSGWKGKDGRQVQDWRALAKEYAAAAARNQLGVP